MSEIVLIACSATKLATNEKVMAKDLYISPLFKLSLKYAKKLRPKKIFILSAKHHLLSLDTRIKPYNVTLGSVPNNERNKWGEKVIKMLDREANLKKDKFIILAGKAYIKPIQSKLTTIENPLEGKRIGKRIRFLKTKLS
jgi:hypothetical protein